MCRGQGDWSHKKEGWGPADSTLPWERTSFALLKISTTDLQDLAIDSFVVLDRNSKSRLPICGM